MNSSLKPQVRAKAVILPDRLLFAASAALLFLAIYLVVSKFDEGLLLGIYQGADSDSLVVWRGISYLGTNATLVPMVMFFGTLLALRGRYGRSLWLAGGWLTTTATVELLKWLVGRARPSVPILIEVRGASFPSGHAAESLFVFYYLWIVLAGSDWLRRRGPWGEGLREFCSMLLAIVPPLVGYSRIYLGAHWPSDVVGGWAIGFFVLGIAYVSTAAD